MSDLKPLLSQVDPVLADYLKRVDRGESVDRGRFVRAHREFSDELTTFFADLERVAELVSRGNSAEGSCDLTAASHTPRASDELIRLDARHWTQRPAGSFVTFGDYELLEELGRGGMGVVFKARQRSLDRIVCVKMMLMSELAQLNEFKRFRAEATAIAQLNHAGIVAIYEVGQHNGIPYYAMEFVEGFPLSKCVSENRPSFAQAADYVAQIAEAIDLAHQNGIVHRDLKPSNVLVDSAGRTHITDFGVAKHVETAEHLTFTGQLLGTPSYMSPEQAEARHAEVGSASDIYSLGAILYALLTGRPPHCGEGAVETVRQVISETPISPRWLNRATPPDLETICLKCLEKSPAARYATAAAVAEDLRRFRAGEPILARPVGRVGKTLRWLRRHPMTAVVAGSILLVALVGAAALTAYNAELARLNRRLEIALRLQGEALDQAEHNELTARNLQYVSDMQLVETFAVEGDYRGSIDLLRRNIPPPGKPDLRGFEWFVLQQRRWRVGTTFATVTKPLYDAAFSPAGTWIAIGGANGRIYVFDATSLQQHLVLESGQNEVNGLAFSSDERKLVSAGDDGTVKVWSLEDRSLLLAIEAHNGKAYKAAFLRNDTALLSCGADTDMCLWDARTGESLGRLTGHQDSIDSFAVSSDERYVWSVSADLQALRFDLPGGTRVEPRIRHSQRPTCIALTPDGVLSVSGDLDRRLYFCNGQTNEVEYVETSYPVQSVAISPDGQWVAAGHRNGSIRVWLLRRSPAATCGYIIDPVMGWNGHDGRVYGIAFTRDGRRLVSVGTDGKAKSWSIDAVLARDQSRQWRATISNHEHAMTFVPETALLATANPQTGVEVWDCAGTAPPPHRTFALDNVVTVGCSPDGQLLAGGSSDGRVTVWERQTGQVRYEWDTRRDVSQLEFSPCRRWLAVVTWRDDSAFRQTQLYDLRTGTALFAQPQPSWRHAAFSPDGNLLYVALDEKDHVLSWDIQHRAVVQTFNQHDTTIIEMGASSDGNFVVSASRDRTIIVRSTLTQTDAAVNTGMRGDIIAFAFGPRGTSLVVLDSLGGVRVFNLRAGQRVIELIRAFSTSEPEQFALSSDGRYVAIHWESELRVYDLLPEGAPAYSPRPAAINNQRGG